MHCSLFLFRDDEILRFVWDSDLSKVLPLLETELDDELYSAASFPGKDDDGEL